MMVSSLFLSIAIAALIIPAAQSFTCSSLPLSLRVIQSPNFPTIVGSVDRERQQHRLRHISSSSSSSATIANKLHATNNDEDDASPISTDATTPTSLSESEQTLLGAAGLIASLIVLYSESVLFQTGCGLPAGPFGAVGAVEGVSYLGVVGLVGVSVFTKVRTGSGLPSGPGGILGAAEGIAYLAIVAGGVVLLSQVTNYGYIPNAVPMEGGMCQ